MITEQQQWGTNPFVCYWTCWANAVHFVLPKARGCAEVGRAQTSLLAASPCCSSACWCWHKIGNNSCPHQQVHPFFIWAKVWNMSAYFARTRHLSEWNKIRIRYFREGKRTPHDTYSRFPYTTTAKAPDWVNQIKRGFRFILVLALLGRLAVFVILHPTSNSWSQSQPFFFFFFICPCSESTLPPCHPNCSNTAPQIRKLASSQLYLPLFPTKQNWLQRGVWRRIVRGWDRLALS